MHCAQAGLGSMVADEEAVQVDETVEDSGEESTDSMVVDEERMKN